MRNRYRADFFLAMEYVGQLFQPNTDDSNRGLWAVVSAGSGLWFWRHDARQSQELLQAAAPHCLRTIMDSCRLTRLCARRIACFVLLGALGLA